MERATKLTWLRTTQAAEYLGVSRRTLEAWRLRGGGPPYHQPARARVVRYRLDELDAWLGSARANTSAEPATGQTA